MIPSHSSKRCGPTFERVGTNVIPLGPWRNSPNWKTHLTRAHFQILSHMANRSRQPLDVTFFALGDATRRGMLVRLSRTETSVSEFAEEFGVALPTIHKHLRVLERAGFILHEKRGRVRHVRLAQSRGRRRAGNRGVDFSPLREVKDWMAQFEAQRDKHLLRLKHQVETDL
jgi:DNA-binding transcriptional ArsR family regulator